MNLHELNPMYNKTTRKSYPKRDTWKSQHWNCSKAQLNHAILRGESFSSLQNYCYYNTDEIGSNYQQTYSYCETQLLYHQKEFWRFWRYKYKANTCIGSVRSKFQLKLPNRFENLQINKDNTVQTAYDKSQWSSIKLFPKEREKDKQALRLNWTAIT